MTSTLTLTITKYFDCLYYRDILSAVKVCELLTSGKEVSRSLSVDEGLKPRHMAEQIGCSAGAASTLLCRARKSVAKGLGKDFFAGYGFAA